MSATINDPIDEDAISPIEKEEQEVQQAKEIPQEEEVSQEEEVENSDDLEESIDDSEEKEVVETEEEIEAEDPIIEEQLSEGAEALDNTKQLEDQEESEKEDVEIEEEIEEEDAIIEEQPSEDGDALVNTERLDLYIEALVFAAQYALNVQEIRKILNQTFDQSFSKEEVEGHIQTVIDKYEDDRYAIQMVGIAGGYLFMTKAKYHKIIGDFLKMTSKKKLSRAAMETLAIIAYKQPIAKSEMEAIRGVSSDYSVQKLLEKELVEITGRDDGPGRPLLYGTTTKFLNHFGLKDASELPKLKEFATTEDTIGVPTEEE